MPTKDKEPTTSSNPAASPNPNKKKFAILFIVLALVAIGVSTWWQKQQEEGNGNTLYVSGRIEGYETNIGAKIGGRVDYIAVREGEAVKKDQLVVQISDADIQAQLRGAEARLLKAQENEEESKYQIAVVESQVKECALKIDQTKEDTASQIAQAESNVAQAKAKLSETQADLVQAKSQLNLAKIRLERYASLEKRGAVTLDENDQAKSTYESCLAAVDAKEHAIEAAQKEVKRTQAFLDQARSTRLSPAIRQAEKTALEKQLIQARFKLKSAQHEIENAKADRDQIQANIAYLTIKSPISAICTARTVEPGAVVVAGQTVLSVIDLDTVYLRAYVPEGKIGKVRVGQKAKVTLDSSPNKPFEGTVIQIDPEASFTPENIYFKEDRVKQVFGIKIAIKQPDRFAKPGMPADAEIEIDSPR